MLAEINPPQVCMRLHHQDTPQKLLKELVRKSHTYYIVHFHVGELKCVSLAKSMALAESEEPNYLLFKHKIHIIKAA